ncbi:antifungal protein ginkbilobin-like protein [Punica granatum]|uniref:Gnk2-homologous domain-containing protein n=2 Tax=Punica granatum TaxID=22663 RepID=A0A218VTN8_PUNGR|nr:antifungal protein ginkbilobin-like protein [Punica granatum]OWM63855.1 hypothetical protein CDL15_Pgr006117 [Punica granatum]PKI68051.1 hypothetical protein CRG98_011647 [Punica granatum]
MGTASHNYIKKIIIVAIGIFSIGSGVIFVNGKLDTTIKSTICSADKYDNDHGTYDRGMRFVLGRLTTDTSHVGYDYYIASPGPPIYDYVYARGVCEDKLTQEYCDSCMRVAVANVVNYCYMSTGAQIQLGDCYVRYEDYPFDH